MHVLVIEDHQEVAELVVRALEKDDHVVHWAASIREAEAARRGHSFGAVVSDLGLPDGSGVEWCRRARARRLAMPLLVRTAQTSLEVIIVRIRKKLGAAIVRTVRGEGHAIE